MKTARIIGTGSYLPKKCITNKELSYRIKNFRVDEARKMLSERGLNVKDISDRELFDAWTQQVTGIEKRHIYNKDFDKSENFIGSTENMGAEAAKKALDAAGISAKDLDYIIFSSFTQENDIPNPACSLAHLIGAKEVGALPINTACSGFIDGLIDAYCRIKSGHYKNIIVVASETLTKVTNYKDPKTAILFADGAGAAVLRAEKIGILGRIPLRFFIKRFRKGILSFYSESDYSQEHIKLKSRTGKIEMGGGPRVLKRAVEVMKKAGLNALERAGLKLEDIDYIIPHQANQRITKDLIHRLGISEKKVIETINNLGNTSGVSVAIALDKAVRGEIKNYEIKRGDKLLLTAVGGGYTLAAMVLEY